MTLLHQALGRQIQFSRFIVYNPTTRAFSTMQQQRLPSDTPTHEIYSHLSCTLHTAALRSWRWQLCTSWPNLGLSPKRGLMNFTTKSSSVMAAMLLKSLPRQQHPHPLELWHDTSPPLSRSYQSSARSIPSSRPPCSGGTPCSSESTPRKTSRPVFRQRLKISESPCRLLGAVVDQNSTPVLKLCLIIYLIQNIYLKL
jgi:hypothetical protein